MKVAAMSIFRGILLVGFGYLMLIVLVLVRVVPSDCRATAEVWSFLTEATLPLLVIIAINCSLMGFCLRFVRPRPLLFVAGCGWVAFVMLSAALAVNFAGGAIFRAAADMGYSMSALQQCVPRMATDFINATAGWLFWATVVVLLATGMLAAERVLRRDAD